MLSKRTHLARWGRQLPLFVLAVVRDAVLLLLLLLLLGLGLALGLASVSSRPLGVPRWHFVRG